jgi:hypothetical protein
MNKFLNPIKKVTIILIFIFFFVSCAPLIRPEMSHKLIYACNNISHNYTVSLDSSITQAPLESIKTSYVNIKVKEISDSWTKYFNNEQSTFDECIKEYLFFLEVVNSIDREIRRSGNY